MKRILIVILAAGLLVAPLSGFAVEPYDYVRVVGCNYWVSLRAEPSKSAERLAQVPLRALVAFQGGVENGFLEVMYGGKRGYILAEYLEGDLIALSMYVANCREYITLRESPSTKASALTKIPLGARVECLPVFDSRSDMARVMYDGKTGYVLRKYLCYLPGDSGLASAEMHTPGKYARERIEKITDSVKLAKLEKLMRSAIPGDIGKCPHGAQLVLRLENGEKQYLTYPLDGHSSMIAENMVIFELTSEDDEKMWEIFDKTGIVY